MILAGVFTLLCFLVHIAAHALRKIHLLKWKQLLQEYPERFRMIASFGSPPDLLVSFFDLMRTLLFGAALLAALQRLTPESVVKAGLILLVLTYLSSELLLSGERAHKIILPFFPIIRIMTLPLYLLLRWTVGRRAEGEPDEEPTDAEVSAYLDLGKEEGVIEDSEGELFQSLVEFADALVREVMTPRTDVVVIRAVDSELSFGAVGITQRS